MTTIIKKFKRNKPRFMKQLCVTSFFMTLAVFLSAQHIERPGSGKYNTTVAIVVDSITWINTRTEISAYKQSLEERGMGAFVIAHTWKKPEEIREILKDLYNQKPKLEGALLIGNIPIAMIRDAQHLSSTFKMDQRIDWKRSSIPSDRFYDDFDLQFKFLKRDSLRDNYFYYSLSAESPQRITMDIYTSRIKPSLTEGIDYYETIRAYLKKIVVVDKEKNAVDNLMVYTGYGYNSESLNSWAGEQIALREQFPKLFKPGSKPKFMNFRMDSYMKNNLLSEVQREDLDFAIFHGHGDEETQLINGYPYASNPNPSIDNIRRYLRSKIQAAHKKKQDIEVLKKHFEESLGVPTSWMADALIDSVMQADSLFEANINISIADVREITPNARMIILDHCDNGEFHLDSYIAGQYAFGKGKTMVVLANSVGVLQDQWPGEMLGILQYGTRVGNWFKHVAYLETHLFGDPTYAFTADSHWDINNKIVNEATHASTWSKLLKVGDPDVQALALAMLKSIKGSAISGLLKETYFASPYGTTRMEALKLLSELDTRDYTDVLKVAVDDPYELIQRLSVNMIGDKGTDELIPALVHSAIANRYSKRVSYRARESMSFMNSEKVLAEINRQVEQLTNRVDKEEIRAQLVADQENTRKRIDQDFIHMTDLTAKERAFNIKSLRVYRFHTAVPYVCQFIQNENEEAKLRIAALEALSWFTHSYERSVILQLCNGLIENKLTPDELREQAFKTRKILGQG